ncbi:MAG: histidinol dehydrogenase [Bacteroidetes bacterium]|nr:histidinol dehydrogenase [Bacteroidota bacterium]
MKIIANPEIETWKEICKRPLMQHEGLENSVKNILKKVKEEGDVALRELTLQFDNALLNKIQVQPSEIEEAVSEAPDDLKKAILIASENIRKFHASQQKTENKIETTPGVVCWRMATPIEKIGIYIPGGTAPLFSSVLMIGIPAKLAGCTEIILCTPPDSTGKVNSSILFAANHVGITKIYKIGGAQAIAALAYGTESIPSVYKILGPGNQYVTKAKQLVSLDGVAIDMPAGPSEVLVLADDEANPSFVAADLLSQAEHGEDSQVILVAYTGNFIEKVLVEIENQLLQLPRKEIAQKVLLNSYAIVLSKALSIEFINEYAPEHLIINTKDCDELVNKIKNAGSVFLGGYSPESAGDYASGTNHTLPTNGYARCSGGLSLESFQKYISIQKISKLGLRQLGPTIETMAEAEQLRGHAQAVRIRDEK